MRADLRIRADLRMRPPSTNFFVHEKLFAAPGRSYRHPRVHGACVCESIKVVGRTSVVGGAGIEQGDKGKVQVHSRMVAGLLALVVTMRRL